jgi:hypothetical protein
LKGVTHIANGTGNEDLDLEVRDIEDKVEEISPADSAGEYRSWRSFRCVGPFCRVMNVMGRVEISSRVNLSLASHDSFKNLKAKEIQLYVIMY